jgi:hypothetical protein
VPDRKKPTKTNAIVVLSFITIIYFGLFFLARLVIYFFSFDWIKSPNITTRKYVHNVVLSFSHRKSVSNDSSWTEPQDTWALWVILPIWPQPFLFVSFFFFFFFLCIFLRCVTFTTSHCGTFWYCCIIDSYIYYWFENVVETQRFLIAVITHNREIRIFNRLLDWCSTIRNYKALLLKAGKKLYGFKLVRSSSLLHRRISREFNRQSALNLVALLLPWWWLIMYTMTFNDAPLRFCSSGRTNRGTCSYL